MKTTFNIYTDNFDYSTSKLFIEITPKQITAFVLDGSNCFNNLLTYSLSPNNNTPADEIKEIVKKPLLNNNYKEVIIMWAIPESILTPAGLFNDNSNNEMLSLVFGPDTTQACMTDILPNSDIRNVYRVNDSISLLLADKFPGCRHYHQFSILPEIEHKEGASLLCIFYNLGFSVRLQNNDQVFFINYFNYSRPEDVLYYLLRICKSFFISTEEVNLILAGLIEKESILYQEIYKYFLKISFLYLPDGYTYRKEFENYPEHFFSYLFAMATCV